MVRRVSTGLLCTIRTSICLGGAKSEREALDIYEPTFFPSEKEKKTIRRGKCSLLAASLVYQIPREITSRKVAQSRHRHLSRLGPTNEDKPADSLEISRSKYSNGIADRRPLYAGRPVVYAGLFVINYIRPEPQPAHSWDEAEDH